MRSMRSETGLVRPIAWMLAALFTTALLMTVSMLAIPPSATLLSIAFVGGLALTWVLHAIHDWRGFRYLATMLATLLLGHVGLLLGLAQDLGPAGLLVLGSWCSARTGFGLGEVWAMLNIAPLAHAGMFLGCNAGMLLAGCGDPGEWRYPMSRRRFLLSCNIGMALGMMVMQLWQPSSPGPEPLVAALSMSGQMLFGMAAGMAAVWWLAGRSPPARTPALAAAGEGTK